MGVKISVTKIKEIILQMMMLQDAKRLALCFQLVSGKERK